MKKTLRGSLTYANVVSTLCLFLLLGGGAAFAASHLGKNSVGAKQLKKNAVTTPKIRKNAVTTAKIGKEAVTGAKIKLSSLGTVPAATNATNAAHANAADAATNAGNLAAPEAIHVVGASGEPLFENGFEDLGPPVAPLGFYEDRQCVVHFDGDTRGEGGVAAFTLPAAYRPAADELSGIGVGGPIAGSVEIQANGEVKPFSAGSGSKVFGFTGISFRAATC
jgi:hypothetical protein